jgi:sulfide dehydrogenase cytochrome subunit
MKMKKNLFASVAVFMLFLSAPVISQGVDRAELLASMCITCHGPDGQGSKRIPALDNHTEQEFMEYLNGFKSGEERATIMDRHANGYSDEEFRLIARYFFEAE